MRGSRDRPDEGVELAPLAAGVDAVGQVREQVGVVAPARELGGQHRGVDAGEHGPDPRVEHVAREPVGRPAPEREDRCDAGAGEIAFAVLADVLEEQVAEDHLLDAVATRGRDGARHPLLVDVVRTERRDLDDVERHAETVGLRVEQLAPHRVHRDPVRVGVHRDEEPRTSSPSSARATCSARVLSLPLLQLIQARRVIVPRVEDGFHVDDGCAVQRLEVADEDARAVDRHDVDPVQPDGIGPVGGAGAEHPELRVAGVVARPRGEHRTVGPVEPGQHDDVRALGEVARALDERLVEDEPGFGRSLVALAGSIGPVDER